MAEAAERGARMIVLRAGDFFGGGRGAWLDLVIAKEIGSGRLTYPGPLELVHEWAYLPDLATALVRLAAIRDTLPRFETFCFAGHAVTGHEFTQAIAKAAERGLEVKRMTWWLVHALRAVPGAAARALRDRLSLARAAPHRRRQAQGRDRRGAAHAA